MKKYIFLILLQGITIACLAQLAIEDRAIRYQQERMVFKQWDRKKFEPTSGWLGINPYYWLTWGLHPSYPKTDRRPLRGAGPQTQRLGLVAGMNSTSNAYKLEADTLRNTALLEIANNSATISAADPLWIMYYSRELKAALDFSDASILSPLPAAVRSKVLADGSFSWFKNELEILKERINGARSADMDRGSRILVYHRLLMEYRNLQGNWTARTATASANQLKISAQEKVQTSELNIGSWSSDTDVEIAKEVLKNRKY
ncbi:hypothetical protein [Pedobacter nyackensis]|uniref:hypothetical protein n=1 Tax=Pedobacter nyackensis TaxID=475255 RepID=UPI002931A48C|nr:hypothetical protein [Pedobacter nyackensis]